MADLVTIFCEVDDFCKEFKNQYEQRLLSAGKGKRKRAFTMTMSEVMTISIWYHHSGYATFKDFYTKEVEVHLTQESRLVSYNRFIELRRSIVVPLLIFLLTRKLADCTGLSFIDSFKLEACHIKRTPKHKVLASIAKKSKTSTGWFYGTKVHLIINQKGEIVSFLLTPGNVSDNNQNLLIRITKKIWGKLFGDKGYLVNPETFEKLFANGVHLVTNIRKNMKNKLMDLSDKLLLKKRGVIESVGNILKNRVYIQHTRHRSLWGFLLNIISSLIAYQQREVKPTITLNLRPQRPLPA
jgi:hypothetical protein